MQYIFTYINRFYKYDNCKICNNHRCRRAHIVPYKLLQPLFNLSPYFNTTAAVRPSWAACSSPVLSLQPFLYSRSQAANSPKLLFCEQFFRYSTQLFAKSPFRKFPLSRSPAHCYILFYSILPRWLLCSQCLLTPPL